jgi:protein involved in polysaccharide export with SLBB domain
MIKKTYLFLLCFFYVAFALAEAPLMSAQEVPPAVPLKNKDALINQKEYHIGPLDLIEIKVLYSDEISRAVRVDSKGDISLPLIGIVKAAGLTPYELEQSITQKLAVDLIQNPQVSVFIKEFTSQRMTVQGVVNRAGVYDFQGQATLLQAISMAGGLMEKADETTVKVIRKSPGKNEETLTYDINVIRENKMDDPTLQNGDVVMVEEKQPISVQGAVKLPGIYYLRGHATLMKVIAQSGGISDIADKADVKVVSSNKDGRSVTVVYDITEIRDNKIKDPEIVPGDLVMVESSTAKTIVYGISNTLRGFMSFGTIR